MSQGRVGSRRVPARPVTRGPSSERGARAVQRYLRYRKSILQRATEQPVRRSGSGQRAKLHDVRSARRSFRYRKSILHSSAGGEPVSAAGAPAARRAPGQRVTARSAREREARVVHRYFRCRKSIPIPSACERGSRVAPATCAQELGSESRNARPASKRPSPGRRSRRGERRCDRAIATFDTVDIASPSHARSRSSTLAGITRKSGSPSWCACAPALSTVGLGHTFGIASPSCSRRASNRRDGAAAGSARSCTTSGALGSLQGGGRDESPPRIRSSGLCLSLVRGGPVLV